MAGDNGLPETYHLEGGNNFGVWAYRMKNLLQKDGRFHYCITPPKEIMSEEEKTARQQVLSIINSNAKNTALKLLRRYKDPYECWTGLKTRYESDSGPRRVMLIDKFFSLRKTDSISMDDHLTEVKEIANLLEEVEVKLPEDIIVYYTLKNLPKEYEIFKRMQIGGQSLPTYEQLEAKLISEETSIKLENQHRDEGEAFFSHHDRSRRSAPNTRYRHPNSQRQSFNYRRSSDSGAPSQTKFQFLPEPGGPSHTKSQQHSEAGASASKFQHVNQTFCPAQRSNNQAAYQPKYRPRGPEKPRSERCNFCNLEGHFERECDLRAILDRMKAYENTLLQQRERNFGGQVHHIEEPDESTLHDQDAQPFEFADQVIDACLVELNLCETPSQIPSWYLDSGATHHVSGDSLAFSSIRPTSGSLVRSAGGQSHEVTGIGNTNVQLTSGKIKSISSILYTPGITKNLLSVGTLADQHKTLVFRSNGCFVIDNTTLKVELFAPREKGLYKLSGVHTSPTPEVNMLYTNSQARLWHMRLGHFHTKGLQRMINFEAVKGLPPLRFSRYTCNGCQLGKHSRTKLPKHTSHSTTQILELIHSDVCGPFKVNSLGGHKFFVTFIDDFSRKMWVFFISHKSQVLSKFQQLVHLLETSTGKRVQALRTDNGGEFTSTAFSDFCISSGISRELPPPYTPERNGVAERRNRSLLDITRCLLLDRQLPAYLWGEAIKAAADILNLRSTKSHPDKTPEELFTGKKPSISHLKIFGSPVFAHVPKVARSKLAARSEQCILLSFDIVAKAYRCFRPSTRKVFISRDILVDEAALLPACQHADPLETPPVDNTPAPTKHEDLQVSIANPLLPSQTTPTRDLEPGSPQPPSPTIPTTPHSSPILTSDSPTPAETTSASLPAESTAPASTSPKSTLPDLPRRSDRIRRFPRHLYDYAAHIHLQTQDFTPEDLTDNISFKQAQLNPHWRAAMQEEINSIHSNHTWSLVPLPPNTKAITSRWVFKVKPGTGNQTRFKARLVARGFEQTSGVDFFDTFAPVVRWETIRTLLAIAVHLNWPIHQLDVLTAFLNGILKEDVYMVQPPGFIKPGLEHLVCKLHKSLYGLRQSPRAWYARLHAALLTWNLLQSHADPNLYYAHIGNDTIALLVYVDDILITGSNLQLLNQLKSHLHHSFKTKDLGPITRYLGIQFERTPNSLRMHQTEYALNILQQFGMDNCKPSQTPLPEGLLLSKQSDTPPIDATLYRMLVGKLLFLTKTRPDISYAVSVVSRFMQSPHEIHLQAAKHILRYVRHFPDLGLTFSKEDDNCLRGFTDADYGQDLDDRISVGAYIFFLGQTPISWNSKKQSTTSRSSCESEYRALAKCSCEAVWLRRLLAELRILDAQPTTIYCDNQSSIKLSYNPVFHDKSKHFEIDYHFTRQQVEHNTLRVKFISSQEQPADILTKSLGRLKFDKCRSKLHLCSPLT